MQDFYLQDFYLHYIAIYSHIFMSVIMFTSVNTPDFTPL